MSSVYETAYENNVYESDAQIVPDPFAAEEEVLTSPEIDAISSAFVGDWKKLVSQTNWEKGRLIFAWRKELMAAEQPRAAYSDEAWARRVDGITSQHVGRLRRVYERFGEVATQYSQLFWSHFQAALEWNDAEMWLEGAVQNDWSVAQMRVKRWETQGAPAHLKPSEHDIIVTELDEDAARSHTDYSARDSLAAHDASNPTKSKTKSVKGDSDNFDNVPFDANNENHSQHSTSDVLARMRAMKPLPENLQRAIETLEVAILNHKAAKFRDVDPQRILVALDTLKQIVLARETS